MRLKHSIGIKAAIVVAGAAVALTACGSSGGGNASAEPSGSSGDGSGASGSPIKIGTVGQYSGFAADTSKATAESLQAWAQDVNAKGGIHGHPVQVIVKDDAADAAKSVAAVKDLIENQHVVALVGNHESGLDATWAKYADSKNVPVVGGVATGATYTTDPNFFPIGNTGVNGSSAYANAAKLFGKSSVSVVYCAEVPACKQGDGLLQYYAKALGLKDSGGQALSASATSYAAQCQKMKDDNVEAVFTATARPTAESFIKQCRTQGYNPLFIDNPQNWDASATADPVWEGAILASDAPLWFGDGPGTAEYLAAMKKYQPDAVLNASGTAGWISGKLFEAAVDKAFENGATGDVTSQTVYDGLYALGPNFDLGGTVAPVTYAKDKPAVQQLCAWYAQVENSKLTAPKGYNRICLDGVTPPKL